MKNPNEILEELSKINERLRTANKDLELTARNKAMSERNYRMALAIEELRLKAEKYPATLIIDLARGNEEVANKKLDRDTQDAVYDAKKYEINSIHIETSVLQSMLGWYKSEFSATNSIN